MNKTDAILLAQLLKSMQDLALKLETSYTARDIERFEALKKELLGLQRKIETLL